MSDANGVTITLYGNGKPFSEMITESSKKLDQLAGKSKAAGHTTVSSVQAASGALREMNGDFTNNIRACERFITTIPGVGDALKNVFPLVGGLAFASMIGAATVKVYEFAKAGREAAKNTGMAWDALNDSTRKSGAELDVMNDKLENSIAKLEHKPANLLKLALDEDRKAAYDLASEVDTANGKVKDLLKEHSTGLGKQLAMLAVGQNVSITTGSDKVIKDAFSDVRSASRANVASEEKAAPGPDAEAVKIANRTRMLNALGDAADKVNKRLQLVYAKQRTDTDKTDYSNETEELEDALDQLKSQRHNVAAGYQHGDDAVKQQRDEEAKQRAEDAKRAATEAAEARRKAAADQMGGYQERAAQLGDDPKTKIQEEFDFWTKMAAAANTFPENLRKINEKIGELRQESGRELEQLLRGYEEAAKRAASKMDEWERSVIRMADEQDKAIHRDTDALAQLSAVNEKNADSLQEMILAHDASTGAIDRHAAAMQAAALHADAYAAALAAIAKEKQADDADASLTPDQRKANQDSRDVRAATIQGEAQRTAKQDQWEIEQTAVFGGVLQSLSTFAATTTDVSARLKDVFGSALEDTNQGILKVLTSRNTQGQHVFGNIGADIFRSGSSALLRGAEGSILKGFGIGKDKAPKGTSGDPLFVKLVSGMEGAGKHSASAISSLATGAKHLFSSIFGHHKKSAAGPPLSSMGDPYGDAMKALGVPKASATSGDDSEDSGSGVTVTPGKVSAGRQFAAQAVMAGGDLLKHFIFPGFADGTDNAPGGPAWIGENGPEMNYRKA